MNLLKTLPLSAALVAAVVAAPGAARAQGNSAEQFAPSDTLCRIGAYRSPGGELVALTRREKGYRYVFLDDRTGYLADTSGYERLAELRGKYGQQPWFKAIKGEFSGEVLAASEAELRALAGKPDPLDLEWRFDSRPMLQALEVPILYGRATPRGPGR
jgi:hypothetical protein